MRLKRSFPRRLVAVAVFAAAASAASGQEKGASPALAVSRNFRLSGYTQVAYTWSNDSLDSFTIRRARLTLAGDLARNVKIKLQVDMLKSPILLDAQVDVQFKPFLEFRFGQYYVPFGRENRTSTSEIETVFRAQIAEKLAPGRDIGASGRDIGAMVLGKFSIFEYMAGVFNGSGINKLDTNEQKDLSVRVGVQPMKSVSLGASIYDGRYSPAAGVPAVARDRTGIDGLLTLGRFFIRAEYMHGRDDLTQKGGWYVQAAYDAIPKKLQAVAKWDSYDPDRDAADDRTRILTLGFNWWLTDRTRVLANALWSFREGAATDSRTLILQFQAGF
jgi:phosphate-selective porin